MNLPPEDAVCIEEKCNRDATCERVTGVNDLAIDEDGFCWETEWVCYEHQSAA